MHLRTICPSMLALLINAVSHSSDLLPGSGVWDSTQSFTDLHGPGLAIALARHNILFPKFHLCLVKQ